MSCFACLAQVLSCCDVEPTASRHTSTAAGGPEQVSSAAYEVKAESEELDNDDLCSGDEEEDQ